MFISRTIDDINAPNFWNTLTKSENQMLKLTKNCKIHKPSKSTFLSFWPDEVVLHAKVTKLEVQAHVGDVYWQIYYPKIFKYFLLIKLLS